MKTVLGLLAWVLVAAAQSSPPSAPVVTSTLPGNWVGLAVAYDSMAHPRTSGGVTEASLVSAKMGMYSYTTWDVTMFKSKATGQWEYQSTPRTGLAVMIRQYGPIYLAAFGNLGVATTGVNASFASSAGGMAIMKIGKTNWSIYGGAHVLNTGAIGGTNTVPEFGVGRSF